MRSYHSTMRRDETGQLLHNVDGYWMSTECADDYRADRDEARASLDEDSDISEEEE